MGLVRLCGVDDVPTGEARRISLGEREVAVVNLGDDGFRAVDAVCSHAHYYLDEGEVDVEERTIECSTARRSTWRLANRRPCPRWCPWRRSR
jgi:nitrite reductase/ring-hydroxylating ferredoxin subunit